jgi:hypothetical protein
MTHDHPHQCGASLRDYFVGQLLTIFVAGVFGLVGILMYRNGQLGYILALPFHRPVLIGGCAVLVLVILRAISVGREAGQLHRHDHARQQPREPDPGTDDHGHDHDLTWVFSRLLVLCFPVCVFLIGVPNSGFSQDRIRMLVGGDDALTGNLAAVAHRNGTVASVNDLHDAANDEARRESMTGQTATLEGRIRRIDARQFTLFRLRMTCCAADTVALKVRIVLKTGTLSGIDDFEWVEMRGRIQFVQAPNSERYIPVIVVEDVRDIRTTEPKNEYE